MFLLPVPLIRFSWLILGSLLSATVLGNPEPNCPKNCGNLKVQYPFGIGEGCFMTRDFEINCNTSFNPARPFFAGTEYEVVEIPSNISLNQVSIKNNVSYFCFDDSGRVVTRSTNYSSVTLTGTPYTFSYTENRYTVIGCNSDSRFLGMEKALRLQLTSMCYSMDMVTNGSCSGLGCAQYAILKYVKDYEITVSYSDANFSSWTFNPCGYAFLADQNKYYFESTDLFGRGDALDKISDVPLVLDWVVGDQTCQEAEKNLKTYACKENSTCRYSDNGLGYYCSCKEGYEGNPYVSPGCQDIDECEGGDPCERGAHCTNTPGSFKCTCPNGVDKSTNTCIPKRTEFPILKFTLGFVISFLSLIVGFSWLYLTIKKRKLIKLRHKFFEQNGGLLLQQRIAFHEGAEEYTKIFTAQELEKATDNYSDSRIIGRGGNGTVYKGSLPHNKVIAIKKSRVVDKIQIEQFINEVVILTQINHRNVVKLLGCCLETEVPLLVYEFVSNGNLSDHIHSDDRKYSLSWKTRLRIASESAYALAYLHSATSTPIIHRDVKSSNILLDDKYTAKVSDFGISRLIPIDQSQISTLVQGTLGYLDPKYFQTGQLTEKSDVYSLGVVLVELLTGEKAISFERSEEHTNLSSHFIISMQQSRLFEILEARVMQEGKEDQLVAFAELAKRCLNLKSEERPTMKEVLEELEGFRRSEKHPLVKANSEKAMGLLAKQDLESFQDSPLDPLCGVRSGMNYNEEDIMEMSMSFPR